MEIEVGEYVRINKDFRTICIGIGKVVNKNQDTIYIKMSNNDLPISFNINSIVKHSKNIIDLVEKGDYVNGQKVIDVTDGFVNGTMEIELSNHRKIYRTHIEDIKSIVTNEQFENIEYKVEEDK